MVFSHPKVKVKEEGEVRDQLKDMEEDDEQQRSEKLT